MPKGNIYVSRCCDPMSFGIRRDQIESKVSIYGTPKATIDCVVFDLLKYIPNSKGPTDGNDLK